MASKKDETYVVAGPITVSAPDGQIELAGGQELTPELVERIGPSRMAAMQRYHQVVPKKEADAKTHPLDVRPFPDVGVDKATVEQLGPEDARDIRHQMISAAPILPNVSHASHADTGLHATTPTAGQRLDARTEGANGATDAKGDAGDSAWHSTSIDDLDIHEGTRTLLKEHRLTTVGKVLDYGEKHDGLGTLEGVGEAREQEIQKAIKKAQKKHR